MLVMVELCLLPDCTGIEFILSYNSLHSAALEPEGLEPTLCFQADNALRCLCFNPLLRPRISIHIT